MIRPRTDPEPALLDPETWEAPFSFSDEDLYAHAGADLRRGGWPADDPEDER